MRSEFLENIRRSGGALAVFIVCGFSVTVFFDSIQQSLDLPLGRRAPSDSSLSLVGATPAMQREARLPAGQANVGLPVRLRIPKINVDAAIESVSLAQDGAMEAPKSPDDVAWFLPGTRPGEKGSAVIAGHYGWRDGKAAAFDSVHELQKGDMLYVEDEGGATLTFVVREVRTYDPQADASEVFSSSDGEAHLNLITCEGVWNAAEQRYFNRLVVFADRVY